MGIQYTLSIFFWEAEEGSNSEPRAGRETRRKEKRKKIKIKKEETLSKK